MREAAYVGRERFPFMDRDGLAAELIYASVGMGICMHRDAEYKDACMWAYNRWLAEMCADAPDRIFGMAQTAVLDIDSAIADFQRAKDMGMVGMMMPGDPIPRGRAARLRPPRLRRAVGVRQRPAAADRLPHPHVARRQPARRRPAATR